MHIDLVAYRAFLERKAVDLRRIAARTRGGMTAEDLRGEALLAAEYHATKRGAPIDWEDPNDQQLILGTLTVEHVWGKSAERALTIRIEHGERDDDQETRGTVCIDWLPADDNADPLLQLERREDEAELRLQTEAEDEILESYSQAVAYNIALWRFNNIRQRLAEYLAIDRGTLRERISAAAKSLKIQQSLFDRVETLGDTFVPLPGIQYRVAVVENGRVTAQLGWEF